MAFTSNCDVFISVNEAGINLVVGHVMRQRPSLFNYGTEAVIRNPQLLCSPINAAPAVFARKNPLVARQPALAITGTQYGLDYALQLTQVEVDFSPGNVIALPAELHPPLSTQRMALHFRICAGLGCPSDDLVTSFRNQHQLFGDGRQTDIIVLPSTKLNCFCLDVYGIGDARISHLANDERIFPHVDGLDIVDIKPDGLEDSLLCYVQLMLKLGLLAKGFSIPNLTKTVMGITISAVPTPTSAAVPFNPALEDDQIKLFVNVTATPPPPTVQPCVASPGGSPPPPSSPPTRSIGWGAGPATPVGPNHLTVAISAKLVGTMFVGVRNAFHPCFTLNKSFSFFTARLAAGGHLDNGVVTLADDGTISITNLALKWDTLKLNLDVNIPQICVGGFCIIPIPFDGCAVRAPQLCIFGDNPDFTVPFDLSGLITSRVTATVRPFLRYGVETTRPPTMTDLDAEDAGIPNLWALFLDPRFLHIEFIDFPDFVANLLERLVDAAIDNLLGGLPGWAKDLIKSILGGAISIIRTILGIPGDIITWLSHLLGVDLNLFDYVTTLLAQLLLRDMPLLQFNDPLTVPGMEAQTTPVPLIPVEIPVRDLTVQINSAEMVLQAKVGA